MEGGSEGRKRGWRACPEGLPAAYRRHNDVAILPDEIIFPLLPCCHSLPRGFPRRSVSVRATNHPHLAIPFLASSFLPLLSLALPPQLVTVFSLTCSVRRQRRRRKGKEGKRGGRSVGLKRRRVG